MYLLILKQIHKETAKLIKPVHYRISKLSIYLKNNLFYGSILHSIYYFSLTIQNNMHITCYFFTTQKEIYIYTYI